jgi:hypothetical protein
MKLVKHDGNVSDELKEMYLQRVSGGRSSGGVF